MSEIEYLSFSRLKALSVCPREFNEYLKISRIRKLIRILKTKSETIGFKTAALNDLKQIDHKNFGKLSMDEITIEYIDKIYPESDAMNEGSLLDCILFTPDDLERRFHFWEKVSRTTKEGKAAYAFALEVADGRTLMTTEQYAQAEFLATCIDRSTFVRDADLLNPDHFMYQHRIEFTYNGFLHKGVPDAVQIPRVTHALDEHAIWDLKKMGNHAGEWAVKNQIRSMQYDLQAAIYCHEYDIAGVPCRYYVIAVSDAGYVTPVEITIEARNKARERWNRLIEIANYCNIAGLDEGPEVFATEGRFIY